ncbi:hypothetical protein EVAR_22686_1 [Eumeta japonica]|uniref:Uncharacterized protein n=1 Tax=Eumeta variegata TaxID=151549 RepID=A0A4C1UTJ8_EUMVA|nr:hypothetical protein EVAR_22686_1 [Eumeta japonica]
MELSIPCHVYDYVYEFKRSRTNLTNDLREGYPSTTMIEDNFSAVWLIIETDKKVTYQLLSVVYYINAGYESCVYCNNPETKRQAGQWVFRLQKLPTKVQRGRRKKDGCPFFVMTDHYATIVLEDKKNSHYSLVH